MSRIKNYVIPPIMSFIIVWGMLNSIIMANTISYLWTFKSGMLTNWWLYDWAKRGILEVTDLKAYSDNYSMMLQTVQGEPWHYVEAVGPSPYYNIEYVKIELWWYIENPIAAMEFAFNELTGRQRIVGALRWQGRPKTWQWWQTGDGLGRDGVGVWTDFNPPIYQDLQYGVWHHLIMHMRMTSKYLSFESDGKTWDISEHPIKPFPSWAPSNSWEARLVVVLSLGAKADGMQATAYFDDVDYVAHL